MEKREPCALLVGMWIGATTMGNSMEIPQKIKNRATLWSSNSTSGYLSEEVKTVTQNDIWTPMFIAALFTITHGTETTEVSTNGWMDKETVVYIHNGILFSHRKSASLAICDNMDGPQGYYAKLSKSEKNK